MTCGTFITFEGGEGSGKSTQARLLASALAKRSIDVVVTREPGGAPLAERLRDAILAVRSAPTDPLAEALVFYAARADHLVTTIKPALEAGRWVISDRFSDSTRAYQGAAGGVAGATLDQLEALVVGGQGPELTFLLDLDPAVGLARAHLRRGADQVADAVPDSFEGRDLAFHQRLRAGFLAIAQREPGRIVVLDASQPAAAIAAGIWAATAKRFRLG